MCCWIIDSLSIKHFQVEHNLIYAKYPIWQVLLTSDQCVFEGELTVNDNTK